MTGLYIFVVCATGAVLVFRIDIQRAMHPALFTPRAPGPLADPVAVMERVRRPIPTQRSPASKRRRRPVRPIWRMRPVATASSRCSWIRSAQNCWASCRNSRSSARCRTCTSICSAAAMVALSMAWARCFAGMCLTGLVIWWPGRSNWTRSLTVDFSRQWKRVNWDLHSAVGFWTVALIAMWAVTGAYFVVPDSVSARRQSHLSAHAGRHATIEAVTGHCVARPHGVRSSMKHATRVPGQHVARVVLPSSNTSSFLVMFSRVAAHTGQSRTDVCLSRSIHRRRSR